MQWEQLQERIHFFVGMMNSVVNIGFTELDEKFCFVGCTFSDTTLFSLLFSIDNSQKKTEQLVSSLPDISKISSVPVIYSNSVGMAWISIVADTGLMAAGKDLSEKPVKHIFLIGPVFLDDYSMTNIEKKLDRLQLPVKQLHACMDFIGRLPVVSLNRFYEYGIMLNYCLLGTQVRPEDFVHADIVDVIPELEQDARHGNYLAECELLKTVEEGNLQYREAINRYHLSGQSGRLSSRGALQQTKNAAIIFTSLVARSAIRGGLSSETAYTLAETYITRIDEAPNIATAVDISRDVMDNFVHRVHRIHSVQEQALSPQIRESCEYISLHAAENPTIHQLAGRYGYTDYYFSTKFRKETGLLVRDYVMQQKMEQARLELVHTTKSVQEIADSLGFSSQSYFASVFRKKTGMTPGEYRAEQAGHQ